MVSTLTTFDQKVNRRGARISSPREGAVTNVATVLNAYYKPFRTYSVLGTYYPPFRGRVLDRTVRT